MNYLHAYHAGNFADCFKHALLVNLIESLTRKPAPFCILDTHAGAGEYDLESEAARRTSESDAGIGRLKRTRPAALARYLDLVDGQSAYPGSPVLAQKLLRERDRLICCESQPHIADSLKRLFRGDPRVQVHRRSGWEAVVALLPPSEKRGLIFVDPPFEDTNEFEMLARAATMVHGRFAQGIFAGWYPIKRMARVRGFYADVSERGIRDVVAVEFCLRDPRDPGLLNGCGLVVVNPPYQFEGHAQVIGRALLDGLGPREAGAKVEIIRLANE